MLPDEPLKNLVVFEGIDGAGKTTCRRRVAHELTKKGFEVLSTGEFESPIGPWLSSSIPQLNFYEKVLYFAADRASVVSRYRAGPDYDVVLWDRYVLSALAYRLSELDRVQDVEQHADRLSYVQAVNRIFYPPALTLWLRLPVEVALNRKDDGVERLAVVDRHYESLFESYPAPWREIDASRSEAETAASCVEAILSALLLQ